MTKEWGPPTWYLIHTLAEKIIDERFLKMKVELFNIIKIICSNLPCPDCANHASTLLKSVKLDTIKSRSEFKNLFLSFHNHVNKKLNKPQFTLQQLNTKYENANINNIVAYFVANWSKKSHILKLMTLELHKQRALKQFNEWWKQNHIHFNA